MNWIIRNPGYGFSSLILGVTADSTPEIVVYSEGKQTGWSAGRDGDNKFIGIYQTENGERFFSIRQNKSWSKYFYTKVWVGWKYVQKLNGYYQLTVDISPFKTIKKD